MFFRQYQTFIVYFELFFWRYVKILNIFALMLSCLRTDVTDDLAADITVKMNVQGFLV